MNWWVIVIGILLAWAYFRWRCKGLFKGHEWTKWGTSRGDLICQRRFCVRCGLTRTKGLIREFIIS